MAGSAERAGRRCSTSSSSRSTCSAGARPDTERQRVFGGQVAAQALVAATRTVEGEFVLHSLHSYFLRPGDTTVPIVYDVERIRDGRSFATRRVVGAPARPADLLHDRQLPDPRAGPRAPGPDAGGGAARGRACRWSSSRASAVPRPPSTGSASGPRSTCATSASPARASPTTPSTRPGRGCGSGSTASSPTTRRSRPAAFTYASDLTLLGAALVPHGIHIASPRLQPASLDHTIWFHRPFRADEWWLYDQVSPFAGGGRGLALARVFTQSGELVATVAQEGLIRSAHPLARSTVRVDPLLRTVRRASYAPAGGASRPSGW